MRGLGWILTMVLVSALAGCFGEENAKPGGDGRDADPVQPTPESAIAESVVLGLTKWIMKAPCGVNGGTLLGPDSIIVSCTVGTKNHANHAGEVMAISLQNGTVLWSRTIPNATLSPPVLVGGYIVVEAAVESSDGRSCNEPGVLVIYGVGGTERKGIGAADEIVCEDAVGRGLVLVDDVQVLWRTSHGIKLVDVREAQILWTQAGLAGAPSISVNGDIAYLGSTNGLDYNLTALDVISGEVLWRAPTLPGETVGRVASNERNVFAAMSSKSIDVLDIESHAWAQTQASDLTREMALINGALWASSSSRTVIYELNPLEFQFSIRCTALVPGSEYAFGVCEDYGRQAIQAIDIGSGEARWSANILEGRTLTPLAASSNTLAVAAGGYVFGIDIAGQVAKRIGFSSADGSLSGDMLEIQGSACIHVKMQFDGPSKTAVSESGFVARNQNGDSYMTSQSSPNVGNEACRVGFPDAILFDGDTVEGNIAFCYPDANGPFMLQYEFARQTFSVELKRDALQGIGCNAQ